MFSAINYSVTQCVHKTQSDVWRKATYLKPYTPWVDVAIGVILCIVGTLAAHGVIPMHGAMILNAVGGLQISIGLLVKIRQNCTGCAGAARGFIQERTGGG